VRTSVSVNIVTVTGSIARSARRLYLIYSDAHFEVFRPAGATRCTDGGKIWHTGRIPCAIFIKIAVYTPFQDALAVKISLDLLKGYGVIGVLSRQGLVIPKFSALPSGETMRQIPTFKKSKNVLEVLYHRAKFREARISPAARAAKNVGQKR